MAIEFMRYRPQDLGALRELICDPSLAGEFDMLLMPGSIEGWLAEPNMDAKLHWLAWDGGRLAGFAAPFVVPGRHGRFAVIRLGVRGELRRRGIGTELFEREVEGLAERHGDLVEVCMNAWLPSAAAEGFVARRGMARARTFWLMERPRTPIANPEWPAGIRLVCDEDPERSYRDFAAAFTDSFAHHYHAYVVTAEDIRAVATRPGFRSDSYLLAYRGDTCVGFCRGELLEDRGEIVVVGTTQAARGMGLGRALLRWGAQWLGREGAPRVTLAVDGENENALRLYRNEGFEVVRTRAAWAMTPPFARRGSA